MKDSEEKTEIDINQVITDINHITLENDSKEKFSISIPNKININNNNIYNNEKYRIKEIKSTINKQKETFEINSSLNYQEYEENCINQINEFYKIIDNNPNDNTIAYQNLIRPYFNNEILDENYVNNFKSQESIKTSLLYKKYIIKKEDNISYFRTICYELFNSVLEIAKRRNVPNSQQPPIFINEKLHNFQNYGITVITFIYKHIIVLYSLIQIIIYIYLSINNKNKSSEKEIQILWENYETNLYRCIPLELNDLLNKDFSFNISCSDGTKYYYIFKFGISPINKEGENITGYIM